MAKITSFPSEAIISGFKGSIDYFVHDGQPCVRKWPRSPGHKRAPPVEAQWPAFAYIAGQWITLPQEIKDAYQAMSEGSGYSARDLFTASYISGLY